MIPYGSVITRLFCTLPLIFTGLVSLPLTTKAYTDGVYTPDNPAPFKNGIKFRDCADMQNYFNSLSWEFSDTVFSGFEDRPKRDIQGWPSHSYITREICSEGYRTERSPLGTLVCYGSIQRESKDYSNGEYLNNKFFWRTGRAGDSSRSNNCRYR
jgi:hypothetical protein